MAIDKTKQYQSIADKLCKKQNVSLGSGKKGFGSSALQYSGKIFSMLTPHNEFVVKLSKEKVAELVTAGKGKRFEMAGREMKEWLVVNSDSKALWESLANEALRFVSNVDQSVEVQT